MTVSTYSPATPAAGVVPVRTEDSTAATAGCPACPHPLEAHDPIGARFCRATAAAGTEGRGCVCRVG